jgi:hypothetical protein
MANDREEKEAELREMVIGKIFRTWRKYIGLK